MSTPGSPAFEPAGRFEKRQLRITRLETFLVKPRWLFLKVHTDAGIVGLGEPILEGRARTCATAVQELESWLIGTTVPSTWRLARVSSNLASGGEAWLPLAARDDNPDLWNENEDARHSRPETHVDPSPEVQ